VTGIGTLVLLYAAWYLDPAEPAWRFFACLLLFMGAMLGVVLADNLLLLALFWELTSLASFLLIGYWHRAPTRATARAWRSPSPAPAAWPARRRAAARAHRRQLRAGPCAGQRRAHPRPPAVLTALALVLLGAFTKSAQFPFHFWLPHAMAAPTPVSAYLHSATMVKAGVFLLARLYPALAGTEAWFWIVVAASAWPRCSSAPIAIFQHDLKGLLAYSARSATWA
jgi:multicomponent K+:H+ antiporter subunit A